MNNMFTVDMETAKRIERIRKILTPVLIAALIISGLFVPKMKVKAAGSYTLIVNLTNADGTTYHSTMSFTNDEDGIRTTFTIPASNFANYPVNSDGKIGTKISLNIDPNLQERLFSGVDEGLRVYEFDFGTSDDIVMTVNTGAFDNGVCTIGGTIQYSNVAPELHVYANASGTDDYAITPVKVSSVVKEEGTGTYYAVFPSVTLSSELVPTSTTRGITEFTNEWKYDQYGIVLQNGVAKDVKIPLDNILSVNGTIQNAEINLTPVYGKINLPIVFNSGDNGQFSNDADTYTTTVSSTEIVEYYQERYFAVPITMPSVASVTNNYLFMNWKLSAADIESRIEVVKDGSNLNSVAAGDTVNVYFPVSLASEGNVDTTFNANIVSVRGEFSFSVSSNGGSIAEIDAVKTVYASSYDNENGAFRFDLAMPSVTLESGAINHGFFLNNDDNASTYYPYEIDGQTPLNVEDPITDSNFSLVVFSQRVSNTDDASVKKVVLGFTAFIDRLSNYKLTVETYNPMDPANGGTSSEELDPVEILSNGGFKYRYTLPATSNTVDPEIGYGWTIVDSSSVFTRSNGDEMSAYEDGIVAGETIYIIIEHYEQGILERFAQTDGFIINPGTYNVNPGGNYYLTNGTWRVGDDGYTYRVSGATGINVSFEAPLTFTK
ncbi:MAG: hypothetical protein K5858_00610 [Lachnospiraceae bacterium]|nr:hypothetical protein [Lachnospiraceae bacterium]